MSVPTASILRDRQPAKSPAKFGARKFSEAEFRAARGGVGGKDATGGEGRAKRGRETRSKRREAESAEGFG